MASRVLVVLLLSALVGVGSCVPFGRGGEPGDGSGPPPRPRPTARASSRASAPTRHPISTQSPSAQRYFDQGLVLTYGFNHFGAIDAFREAARLDPECAMCFWGVAYAYGPNINAPMGPEGATARLGGAPGGAAPAAPTPRRWSASTSRRSPRATRRTRSPPTARALDAAYAEAMRGAPPAPSRGSRRRDALRRGGDGPAPLGLLDRGRHAARGHPRGRRHPRGGARARPLAPGREPLPDPRVRGVPARARRGRRRPAGRRSPPTPATSCTCRPTSTGASAATRTPGG